MKGRRITSILLAAVIAAAGVFATEVPAAYAKSTPVIENKSNILKEDLRAKSHEALVIFKDTNALSGSEVRSRLSKSIKDIEVRKSWNIRKSGRKTVTVARVRSADRSASQLVKLLKQRSDIRTASLNHQRRIRGGITSDTYADWQWNLASIDASYQWKNGGSSEDEQVIAVVDTGVDYTHEDLESAMWENTLSSLKGYVGYNFIDSNNNPMDGNGHGTHVAGIIAAESNNNKGISGVAPSVKIMALKAIDDEGFGYDSSFIDAYNYISKAQDLGVNIVAVNNSWGGIEENPVLTELINIVGQKGAVSVCAAGNEGEDNDEYDSFPANADSDYIISVGAVGADNKLASYSNYGSSVDAAAPGSNILSTVPYASYNPTIYSDSLRNELTQNGMYADFDGGGLDLAGCIEASDNPKGKPVRTEYVTSNVSSRSGRALKLTADLKAGEVATFEVPFTLEELGESKDTYTKQLSMMVSGQSSKGLGMFLVTSSPNDESIQTIEQMLSYWYSGVFISGSGSDYSDHLTVDLLEMMDEDELAVTDRKLTFMIYADQTGKYSVTIDDFGISKAMTDKEFRQKAGCYDFMSGTSMAAPHISAAVALKYAELESDGEEVDALAVADEVISSADAAHPVNIGGAGTFSFSKKGEIKYPRVTDYYVNSDDKTITFVGKNLDSESLSVKAEDEELEIISQTEKEVTVSGDGIINEIHSFTITDDTGREVKLGSRYCVKGKNSYSETDLDSLYDRDSQPVTDGRYIYIADSEEGTAGIRKIDSASLADKGFMAVDESKLKTVSQLEDKYAIELSDTIAYANGYVYAVCEGGESTSGEDSFDEEDEEDLSSARSLYSSERELIRINASNGKTASLGMLPKSLSGKVDFAMTSYNGEILFIGGYDKPAKGFTDEVIAYNPAAKKYRILASLPEGRAGGLAVQSGNRLVYAYGVSADDAAASDEVIVPELLVYDGKSWKKSEAELQLIKEYETDYVEEKLYGKKRYNVIKASIGIAKNGIVLIGAPFKVYGDTVLYNISKDEFRDSGYTYSSAGELFSGSCQGCSAGDRIFARSSYDDGFRTAEIDPSDNGMVMVSYNRNTSMAKKGTVSGVNRYRAPGNDVKITVKAGKKYAIRKIKVGSWTKTYSRPRKNVTVTLKRITSDRAVNVTYIKK